jgi:hypothetical protein
VAGDLLVQVLVRMGPTSQLRRVVAALLHNHAPLTQVKLLSISSHSVFFCLNLPLTV